MALDFSCFATKIFFFRMLKASSCFPIAIYELIREGSDMVIPIKYTWNGHSKIVDLGE